MLATEEQIRAKLDGTFTRVLRSGTVRTKRVPVDFIPTHHDPHICNQYAAKVAFDEEARLKPFRAPLTDEERLQIANLAAGGASVRSIARQIGRQPGVISVWMKRMKEGKAHAPAG